MNLLCRSMTPCAKLCAFEVGVFARQGEGGDEESVTWTWLALAHSDFSFYVFAWCLILCGIHLYWACVFWFAESGSIQFFDFSTPATRHRNVASFDASSIMCESEIKWVRVADFLASHAGSHRCLLRCFLLGSFKWNQMLEVCLDTFGPGWR